MIQLCPLQGHSHEQMMLAIADRAALVAGQMLPQVGHLAGCRSHRGYVPVGVQNSCGPYWLDMFQRSSCLAVHSFDRDSAV